MNRQLKNLDGRNAALKRRILGLCINDGDNTIADLAREVNVSVPTATKLISELIDSGFLMDLGKFDTGGGRRPSIYGLNPEAGFFVGTDVRRHHINLAVTDFKGGIVSYCENIPYVTVADEQSLKGLCRVVLEKLDECGIERSRVLAYGFNLTGRVNNDSGYSFSYFLGDDRPLDTLLEGELGAPVLIENDSRAMAYGEYIAGVGNGENNMIFLNLSWGLGMGMIVDGKLCYGKSGFCGEIGHFPLLDNNIICKCGKIGCLETGASGLATHRIFLERLAEGRPSVLSDRFRKGEEISLADILDALKEEDVLAIETIEEIGSVLGRAIAGLINVFNPELVVIGGTMSNAREYLLHPIKAALNKHSLNIVSKDMNLKFSKLGNKAGALGACLISRSKMLGLV